MREKFNLKIVLKMFIKYFLFEHIYILILLVKKRGNRVLGNLKNY